MGRKLFFDSFFEQATVFLSAIDKITDPFDYSLLASAFYRLEEFEKAIYFFKQAGDHGYGRSFYWLGLMYEEGQGVTPCEESAYKYYRLGANYGYALSIRGYLNIDIRRSSFFKKKFLQMRLFLEKIKVGYIAFKNVEDERLADLLPNKYWD